MEAPAAIPGFGTFSTKTQDMRIRITFFGTVEFVQLEIGSDSHHLLLPAQILTEPSWTALLCKPPVDPVKSRLQEIRRRGNIRSQVPIRSTFSKWLRVVATHLLTPRRRKNGSRLWSRSLATR